MFRIKNVRNATVAKHTHVSPSINRPDFKSNNLQKPPTRTRKREEEANQNNTAHRQQKPQALPKKQDRRMAFPKVQEQHKVVLVSKAHAEDFGQTKKMGTSALHHNRLSGKPSIKVEPVKEEEPAKMNQRVKEETIDLNEARYQDSQMGKLEAVDQIVQESVRKEDEELIKFVKKQVELKMKEQEEEKEEEVKKRELQDRINEQEKARRQKEKLERDKVEEQKQKERQRQHQQFVQKIQARKKARFQEKQRKKALEGALKEQDNGLELPEGSELSGLVSLRDPLAHVEMSQALMDRQIQHLLKMKFTDFPNKQAIERQLQELDRINQSYMMVRVDPNNTLIRGLANFRTELFNRVGEEVMAGQAQLGSSASGLQMVEAEVLDRGGVKGVRVTRGLEGQANQLLKRKVVQLEQEQECAICLGMMKRGEQVLAVRCGHSFHSVCISDWLQTTANCPACRYNIKFDHP